MSYRTACIIFWLALTFCQPVNILALPQQLGDLDQDGRITVLDLVRLLGHLRGTQPLQGDILLFADVNQDGAVNDLDAQLLTAFIVGTRPLPGLPLTKAHDTSPSNGERDVSVTRETVFRLTMPLATNTVIANSQLFAVFGGRKILSRIELSTDRRTVTLFYLEPLPGGSRLRVTFIGDGISDFLGRPIDLDGDGVGGGTATVDFDTLATGGVKGTIVSGRVFASELATSGGSTNQLVNRPLPGVTVTVDGMEESLRAVTDSLGNFRLDPAPAGDFFVHIDGRTATNGLANGGYPKGPYYPYVGKEWQSTLGEEINIGSIYLPLVSAGTLQPVSALSDTAITFPAAVVQAHPELSGVTITVPANSLFSENGTRGGMVGIAPVPPDRLPGPLPAGLNFPIVITVQTDGGANFDRPAPVCFPNLPDPVTGNVLPPGAKSALWSYNHDTGRWEIEGPMTVSQDGKTVCTDPGVGIIAPGWHGVASGTPATGGGIYGANPPGATRPRPTGPQECAHDDCPCVGACKTAKAVYLENGEEIVQRTDLMIPGRGGMDFVMDRVYRSRLDFNGPLGFGWTFRYNEGLFIEPNGDVARYNGRSHEGIWKMNADGSFLAPAGYFSILTKQKDGTYVLTESDGFQRFYRTDGRLICHQDRYGNRMLFDYDDLGNLRRVVDVYGRNIEFTFRPFPDGVSRLVMIEDFIGRQIVYQYDAKGNLASVTTPVITGTSTGNDFPNGRTEVYTYSDGFAQSELNHNLLSITAPEEVLHGGSPRLQWTYGTDPNDTVTFDHVLTETEGGTNPSGVAAGGLTRFDYQALNETEPAGQLDLPRCKARITERNGTIKEFFANERLLHIMTREYTRALRPGEPEYYETRSFFDDDGQLVRRIYPAGNEIRYAYQTGGPRRNQANLREMRRVADPLRGGGPDLVTTYTYEPLFNQVATITEPRGNDSSFVPPLGKQSAARYTKKFFYDYQESSTAIPLATLFGVDLSAVPRGLGDLNGDGRTDQMFGNLVRIEAPPVLLRAEANESKRLGSTTQSIISQIQWNDRGQITARIDPEGNVTDYLYYSEDDPDGDGIKTFSEYVALTPDPAGFLKAVAVDDRVSPRRNPDEPQPTGITTTYQYDNVGNVVGVIDPRGVLTRIEVNQLNETVSVVRGADVAGALASGQLLTGEVPLQYRTRYLYDGNGRVIRTDIENRDASPADLGQFIQHSYVYDILDQLIERKDPINPTTTLSTKYRYDQNELLTALIQPEGNTAKFSYDGRNLPFTVTRGFGTPAAATVQVDYDANENRVRLINPGDNDGDGKPGVTTYVYDGFDRKIQTIDPLNNQELTTYDPSSNPIRSQVLGHPPGKVGASNVALEDKLFSWDEVNRNFQTDERLFVPGGYAPKRAVQLQDGNSDGFVTTQREYDALSRLTYIVEDDQEIRRMRYDGAGRPIEVIDAAGNRVATEYDRNSNPVRVSSSEVSADGLVPAELFSITHVFDQLDRPVRVTDNAGQTARFSYDSRNNLMARSDPEGPLAADPLKLFPNGINAPGNTTSYQYDGLNRPLATIADLRLGGNGGGAVDKSNPFNSDGQIAMHFEWDGNSRLLASSDDNGKRTSFTYDALDRRVTQTYADGKSYTYLYNPNDDLIQITDPNGSVIKKTYDELDRPVRAEVAAFGPGVLGTKVETYEYDGLSRLSRTTDDNGDPAKIQDFDRVYDSLSRLIEERQNGQPISSSYSGDGKRLAVTYPGGRRIDNAFDAIDRVRTQSDAKGKIAEFRWIGPEYRQLQRLNANGTRETVLNDQGNLDIGFDAVHRLVKQRLIGLDGVSPLIDREYSYNRMNERTSEKRNDDAGFTDQYTYDSAYRIAHTTLDGGGQAGALARNPAKTDYLLDGAGNRRRLNTSPSGVSQVIKSTDLTVNDVNEYLTVGSANLAYSANGNLTDDGQRLYGYDYHNRLVSVSRKADGAPLARYLYDSANRRRQKIVFNAAAPGQIQAQTLYFYDRWQVCEEQDGSGASLASYVYSPAYIDQIVQMERTSNHPLGAGDFYFQQNARADVIAISDATGKLVEKRFYDDFGRIYGEDKQPAAIDSVGSPFGFQGQRLDAETGFYYFRSRYYDPEIGRFLQRDPADDPLNIGNQYTFAGNSPGSGMDPFGLNTPKPGSPPRTQSRPQTPPPAAPDMADDPVLKGMSVVRGANQIAGMYGYSQAAQDVMNAKNAYDTWKAAEEEAHFCGNMVKAVGGSLSKNISIATQTTVKADQLEKALQATSYSSATAGQASKVTAAKGAAKVGAALQVAEVAANAIDYYNKDERVKQLSASERDRILAEYDRLVREVLKMSDACRKEKLLKNLQDNMEFQLNNVSDSQVTEHLINAAVFLRDSLATFVPGPISKLWGGDKQK